MKNSSLGSLRTGYCVGATLETMLPPLGGPPELLLPSFFFDSSSYGSMTKLSPQLSGIDFAGTASFAVSIECLPIKSSTGKIWLWLWLG